ncbi:MAG TPA: molybdopterin-dependent oxidoreductase, partial [Gemmatimonadaceae bacterium]|nr:molybdopterin-dependent oxidoreductase [Gemmatimonadaceae bacterium]
MLIRRPPDVRSSEITPEALYLDRRRFIGVATGAGIAAAATVLAPALAGRGPDRAAGALMGHDGARPRKPDTLTPYEDVTTYNNFYEFGTGKDDPARNAKSFRTRPWTISVDGEVAKPATYQLEDFVKPYAQQERVYRLRCVEAWS